MYHSFTADTKLASTYVMPIERFSRQMALLNLLKYQVISLDTLIHCISKRRFPPPRSVVITIDDGYADNRSLALPILKKYNYPTTLFLVSQRIGKNNDWSVNDELTGRFLLSWPEVKALQKDRVALGAHSRTHRCLPYLSALEMFDEIRGSRDDLEAALGKPVTLFAYPNGETEATVQGVVQASGFRGACGVAPRLNCLNSSLYALHRSEIRGNDSLLRFLLALWFGDAEAIFPRSHT